MRIVLFSKLLAGFTLLAMVGVFLAGTGRGLASIAATLILYEALAIGGAIAITLAYPFFYGVRKGEKVFIITSNPIQNGHMIRLGTALEDGKMHQLIRVDIGDGGEHKCEIESYDGFVFPARVSMKMENEIKVI